MNIKYKKLSIRKILSESGDEFSNEARLDEKKWSIYPAIYILSNNTTTTTQKSSYFYERKIKSWIYRKINDFVSRRVLFVDVKNHRHAWHKSEESNHGAHSKLESTANRKMLYVKL